MSSLADQSSVVIPILKAIATPSLEIEPGSIRRRRNTSGHLGKHGVAEVSLFPCSPRGCSRSARCVRRQISLNACDQLWNADRLREKWMSLDLQARSCLSFRHQSCQKDNRCFVQCWIGFNPRGDLAAIRFRHRNIKKNKVGQDALRCLVRPGWFVLFPNGVAPRPLQPEFGRASKVTVVIDDEDARLLFGLFNRRGEKISFYNSIHNISVSLDH